MRKRALGQAGGSCIRSMRRLLPLLIGVIVTPLSAAAQHKAMLAHAADEGDTNVPVSRGRVDTGSTEQIYLMLKDGSSFSVPIPMTNRFTCELETKKLIETNIEDVGRSYGVSLELTS